jgi:hypothetical protein
MPGEADPAGGHILEATAARTKITIFSEVIRPLPASGEVGVTCSREIVPAPKAWAKSRPKAHASISSCTCHGSGWCATCNAAPAGATANAKRVFKRRVVGHTFRDQAFVPAMCGHGLAKRLIQAPKQPGRCWPRCQIWCRASCQAVIVKSHEHRAAPLPLGRTDAPELPVHRASGGLPAKHRFSSLPQLFS